MTDEVPQEVQALARRMTERLAEAVIVALDRAGFGKVPYRIVSTDVGRFTIVLDRTFLPGREEEAHQIFMEVFSNFHETITDGDDQIMMVPQNRTLH